MTAPSLPDKIGNQTVRYHTVTAPGRVDLNLCVDKAGIPYIDALHIIGVQPAQAGYAEYMDGGAWQRQVAIVLPPPSAIFDLTNPTWQHGDNTITVNWTAPDLYVLCSLDTFSEHGHKVPDYAKWAAKTHSCVDIGYISR